MHQNLSFTSKSINHNNLGFVEKAKKRAKRMKNKIICFVGYEIIKISKKKCQKGHQQRKDISKKKKKKIKDVFPKMKPKARLTNKTGTDPNTTALNNKTQHKKNKP